MKVEYQVKDGTKTVFKGVLLADNDDHARKIVARKISSHRFSNGITIIINGKIVCENDGIIFQEPVAKKLQGMPQRPW